MGERRIKTCSKMLLGVLLIIAFGTSFFTMHFVFAQTGQTELKLQAANTSVEQAFNTVLAAEKAGANVTGLLAQLNVAAGILAQAENSYRAGDLNRAAIQADSVSPIAQEVATSAQDAKQAALVSGQNGFWLTIAFIVIGAFVFVLVLFLVWRRFKSGYMNNLLGLKPEVVENAA
jgi:preprotein translocase subunit SecF